MNTPEENKRLLREITENAGYDNPAAKQALKMKAALEMVLMFHGLEDWDDTKRIAWERLQLEAGRQKPGDMATTRVLCDTIREVLGLQEERA